MPVHEDGIPLVTIEIGKRSKRKSGNFLVGAADSDAPVQITLGGTVEVGVAQLAAVLQADGIIPHMIDRHCP